ncbi:hypothetical protein HOY82DRAFT_611482 [Tuber indicum]|nr:hypothetical protein HOY82DRAFT_611482 [Tuber indicum]
MSTSTVPVTRDNATVGLGRGGGGRGQRVGAGGEERGGLDSTDGVGRPRGRDWVSVPGRDEIYAKLKDVITEVRPGLQNMYGKTEEELNNSLEVPINRGEEMARRLIREMGCTREVAKELTVLTLYDVAILIDDSDSMIREEGGKRIKTLRQFIDHITEIYSMANESGVLVMRFMNRPGGKTNWTEESSQEYLNKHVYGGVTRIGTELKRKILDVFAIGNGKQFKPLLVLIATDGTVEGEKEGHLKEVIQDCVRERDGAGKGSDAVLFQFSRIGNDSGAAQMLTELDEDASLGKYIDVLPVELDFENQLEDKWFVLPKILIGAILLDWDKGDENDTLKKDHLAEKEEKVADEDWAE